MKNKTTLFLFTFILAIYNCFAEINVNFEKEKYFYLEIEKKLEEIKKEAEKGCAIQQFALGCYYLHANEYLEGRTKDKEKGLYWLRKSAEQGIPIIQTELGRIYLLDDYKDTRKALYWLHKAAEQGEAEAMGYLSHCYAKGDGVIEDYEETFKWLVLAATRGYEKSIKVLKEFEEIKECRQLITQGKERAKIWIKEHPQAMMSPD